MSRFQSWLLFIGSLVVAFFLLWFGSRFLLFGTQELSRFHFVIIAAISLTAAALLIDTSSKESIIVCLLLVLIGAYQIARAVGVINHPWLAKIVAVLCWLGAVFIVSICLPSKHNKSVSS